ncbi:MAG: hypothetical protein HW374_1694 [Bacteroidetes bacterium]|nr:hypothetical protein [Bacteroidota bacterium]
MRWTEIQINSQAMYGKRVGRSSGDVLFPSTLSLAAAFVACDHLFSQNYLCGLLKVRTNETTYSISCLFRRPPHDGINRDRLTPLPP